MNVIYFLHVNTHEKQQHSLIYNHKTEFVAWWKLHPSTQQGGVEWSRSKFGANSRTKSKLCTETQQYSVDEHYIFVPIL